MKGLVQAAFSSVEAGEVVIENVEDAGGAAQGPALTKTP